MRCDASEAEGLALRTNEDEGNENEYSRRETDRQIDRERRQRQRRRLICLVCLICLIRRALRAASPSQGGEDGLSQTMDSPPRGELEILLYANYYYLNAGSASILVFTVAK